MIILRMKNTKEKKKKATYYNNIINSINIQNNSDKKMKKNIHNDNSVSDKKVRNKTIHWCAISPNLLKKNGGPYEFGDTIHIEGTESLDGDYVIHDLTSRKHHNWIDLLVPPGIKHGKWKGRVTKHRKKK